MIFVEVPEQKKKISWKRLVLQMIIIWPFIILFGFFCMNRISFVTGLINEHEKFDTWIEAKAEINKTTKSQYFFDKEPHYTLTSVNVLLGNNTLLGEILIPPSYGYFEKLKDADIDLQTRILLDLHNKDQKIVNIFIDVKSKEHNAVLDIPEISGKKIWSTIIICFCIMAIIILIFTSITLFREKINSENNMDVI